MIFHLVAGVGKGLDLVGVLFGPFSHNEKCGFNIVFFKDRKNAVG